ncbi:hypothetical protein Leryth_003532 [Lithospermum erythrorhizon]|nr:hypothetical protein Leryth_003532 [Lithospermum erythrorhizon]
MSSENEDVGSVVMVETEGGVELACPEEKNEKVRGEIDTSAPFESVKEAATRFGGIGFWRPTSLKHHSSDNALEHDGEGFDISKLEEEAAQLQRDLIMKERETLDVLKELEKTKLIVEELKFEVNSEVSCDNNHTTNFGDSAHPDKEFLAPSENHPNVKSTEEGDHQEMVSDCNNCPSSASDFILKELKRAKLNLTRTTDDLVDIRTTVALYKQKIEKERVSMEMTRQRLSSNVSKISALEEELLQASQKLQIPCSADPAVITNELQRLSSETEQFKKMGEVARSEIMEAISEIEQTKTKLKTAGMRLIAAKKMKEAARASEAVALAEIKWLSASENSSSATQENSEGVTLTFEEYTSLVSKAREAEEAAKARVNDAMLLVDEADESKTKILKKIEETTEEVKSSKKALEDALDRVEAANSSKLIVEEALRKWRSERSQKKRTSRDTTKFKNSGVYHSRRDPALLDVNGIDLAPARDDFKPVLKSTLSIGQILSRKLLLTEEYENGVLARKSTGKRKVSLGQMLGKTGCEIQSDVIGGKENNPQQLPAKRKNFGFAKISFLRTKQSKKKKKRSTISCSRSI